MYFGSGKGVLLSCLRSTVGIDDIAVIGEVPLDTEHLLGDGLVSCFGVHFRGLSIIFDFMGIRCLILFCFWKVYFLSFLVQDYVALT